MVWVPPCPVSFSTPVALVLIYAKNLGHRGSPRHRVLDVLRLPGARGALRNHGLAETIPEEFAYFGVAGRLKSPPPLEVTWSCWAELSRT